MTAELRPPQTTRYRTLFESFDRDDRGRISAMELVASLSRAGLSADDPRVAAVLSELSQVIDSDRRIGFVQFRSICRRHSDLLPRALRGHLVVPDFASFRTELSAIAGEVAGEDEQFAVAVCTVDAQQADVGHSRAAFSVQAVGTPINYRLALEEHGPHRVHKHIGREPVSRGFHDPALNVDGLPHNPMVESGALVAASLIESTRDVAGRFDHVSDAWRRLSAGGRVGFNNSSYLTEREFADRHFALAHQLRERRALPFDADLRECVDFYFQTRSIETDAHSLAMVAAALANAGISPTTGERIFAASTVQRCLSLMSSCGFGDYSGEFAFTVGVPAMSGASGAVMIVVPRILGISVWSPRLDSSGNSLRGVEFCKRLVERFNFHVLGATYGPHIR